MREILFKAKRKNWEELPKEQWWVEGDFYFYSMQAFIVPRGTSGKIKVVPETLCQYTGLTDKNGKRIWENDICDRKEEYPEIVKYHEGDFTLDYSYVFGKDEGYNWCNLGFYVCQRKSVEVIGNIFDNPELLEGRDA